MVRRNLLHKEARSPRLLSILKHNTPILIVLSLTVYAVLLQSWLGFGKIVNFNNAGSLVYRDLAVIIVLLLSRWLRWISAMSALWPLKAAATAKTANKEALNRLLICVVTRGHNPDVVMRTISSIGDCSFDPRIQVYVVTEADTYADMVARIGEMHGTKIVGVPPSFQPPRAKHKARALEWFRLSMAFAPGDWILHLDEETVVDGHCLNACIHFASSSMDTDAAQGVILYTRGSYWRSPLLASADAVRVSEDLGRYRWMSSYLGRPLLGLHGSFLLTSGRLENHVTWDLDCLSEDYAFTLQAMEKGYRCAWLPSFAREQSPQNLVDFVTQRRRWYSGAWQLNLFLPRVLVFCWGLAVLELLSLILWLIISGDIAVSPLLPYLVMFPIAISMSVNALALLIQDIDAMVPPLTMVAHQMCLPFMTEIARYIEAVVALSVLVKPAHGFAIIAK